MNTPQRRPARSGRTSYRRSSSNDSRPRRSYANRGRSNFRGRPQGGRGNRSYGRNSRGRRGAPQQQFDISQFINKAEKPSEQNAYDAKHTFSDFAILPNLAKSIEKRGYIEPTPIQDQIIPHILEGHDVVGLANTGTGKTAAFLIPLINKVLQNRREQVLILAPTRELAIQIEQELFQFSRGLRIFSTTCVGGMPIGPQIRRLKKHNQFIIGTPGRIMDLMERGVLVLDETHSVVLDEADRMLDMGFIADMRFIMAKMPKERHTLFFSATMSPDIKKLIHDFLNNPVTVSVKTRDTSKNVDQDIVNVRGQDKLQMLHGLLVQPEFEKVIIFGETKRGVEQLGKELYHRGIKAQTIHGNKTHGQRQRALKAFKSGYSNVLIATDVAARGLDIDNVSHVINFDLPQTYDDYIHRIGRTGRGSKIGKALTFVG